jgi:hypothetical protein
MRKKAKIIIYSQYVLSTLRRYVKMFSCPLLTLAATTAQQNTHASSKSSSTFRMNPIRLEAEAAQINPSRIKIIKQKSFSSNKGVSLKPGLSSNVGLSRKPDLIFTLQLPKANRCWIRTHASVDANICRACPLKTNKIKYKIC